MNNTLDLVKFNNEKIIVTELERLIEKFLKKSNKLNICLSGGSSLIPTLLKLSSSSLDWSRLHFYLTDERVVEIDNTDSNYYNILKCFNKIKTNIYPLYINNSVSYSKENYEKILNLNLNISNNLPQFDILVLGMGEDGHIASIFNSDYFNTQDLIFEFTNPGVKYKRLSLSLDLLLNSEHKILLTYGNINIIL